ncbi:MAG: CoA-transferase subunit beta [Anaerovoracaceae bacterium]|jgi:glutaconate CoA-transferase subunit B
MINQRNVHPADLMVCTLAHLIEDGETVFQGVSSQLPLVAMKLAKATHAKNATLLNIPGGVNSAGAAMSEYSSAGGELWDHSEAIFPLEKIFDLSMRGKLDVAFLSGVQFDRNGNINASVIGDYHRPKVRLPGGAGSAVLIPTAKKAIIWRTKHDRRTFVEKVDFVTTRGNLYKIVTPLCVFGYREGELYLEAVSPYSSVEEVAANTGFEIRQEKEPELMALPTGEEMRLLRQIDPKGIRYKEFT